MAPKKHTKLIIGLCIFLILAIIGLFAGLLVAEHIKNLTILPNVKVAGVDVGGMTSQQAIAAVSKQIGNQFAENDMTIQVFDDTVTIPAAYSGGTVDVEKAVRAAKFYGQVGFPAKVNQQKQIAATAGHNVNLEPYMQIDKAVIMHILEQQRDKYSSKLVQSKWSVEGQTPTAEDLIAGKTDLKLVVNLGTSQYAVDPQALYAQIVDAYSNLTFSVVGNCTKTDPDPIDFDAILAEHSIAAKDAYWDTENYKVVEAQKGLGFDIENAKEVLAQTKQGQTATIPFTPVEPEVTTQALNERMFRDTLSTYTAKTNSSSGRRANLKLACAAVNGIILNPGETFDYNPTLGERTTERGYKAADAYLNGETIQTIGGGICQVSSTIYYCALMADLEIVERRNHSYPSSYIPLGMDATVSWGGPEFKFRNNTKYPIKIVATASGGNTTVSIMSYDDRDYYVKMEYEVLKKISPTTVYKEFPADNAEGYKDGQVITTAYTGYVVNSYRVKYSKETNQEISREFEVKSTYKSRDKVIAKVEAPVPSAPTEPPAPSVPSGSDILDQIR